MRQPLDAAGDGNTVEERGGVCSGHCLPEVACGCIMESCSAWLVHTLLKTMISKAGPDVRVRFKRARVLSELLRGRHRMLNEPRLDGHSVFNRAISAKYDPLAEHVTLANVLCRFHLS